MSLARVRAVQNEFMALALLADAPRMHRNGNEVVRGENTTNPPYAAESRGSNVFYTTSRRVRHTGSIHYRQLLTLTMEGAANN